MKSGKTAAGLLLRLATAVAMGTSASSAVRAQTFPENLSPPDTVLIWGERKVSQTVSLGPENKNVRITYDITSYESEGVLEDVLRVTRGFPATDGNPPPDALVCDAFIDLSVPGRTIVKASKNTVAEMTRRDLNETDILKPFPTTSTDKQPYVRAALALDRYVAGRIGADQLRKELAPMLEDCSRQPLIM